MQATGGLTGIAGSAIAMPMVQTRHARLSSLVCDGSNEHGKNVVGVAAHYLCSRQLASKGTPKKPTLISYARARLSRHTSFVMDWTGVLSIKSV